MHKLEYLWLDGCNPTQIRSKTKVVKTSNKNLDFSIPIWGFDGSSTEQADGSSSDCVLKAVRVYPNPLESNSSIVLCEVYNVDDTPHETNTRKKLEKTENIDESLIRYLTVRVKKHNLEENYFKKNQNNKVSNYEKK